MIRKHLMFFLMELPHIPDGSISPLEDEDPEESIDVFLGFGSYGFDMGRRIGHSFLLAPDHDGFIKSPDFFHPFRYPFRERSLDIRYHSLESFGSTGIPDQVLHRSLEYTEQFLSKGISRFRKARIIQCPLRSMDREAHLFSDILELVCLFLRKIHE